MWEPEALLHQPAAGLHRGATITEVRAFLGDTATSALKRGSGVIPAARLGSMLQGLRGLWLTHGPPPPPVSLQRPNAWALPAAVLLQARTLACMHACNEAKAATLLPLLLARPPSTHASAGTRSPPAAVHGCRRLRRGTMSSTPTTPVSWWQVSVRACLRACARWRDHLHCHCKQEMPCRASCNAARHVRTQASLTSAQGAAAWRSTSRAA